MFFRAARFVCLQAEFFFSSRLQPWIYMPAHHNTSKLTCKCTPAVPPLAQDLNYYILFPVGLTPSRPGHVARKNHDRPIASGRSGSAGTAPALGAFLAWRLGRASVASSAGLYAWARRLGWGCCFGLEATCARGGATFGKATHACPRRAARVVFLVI